MSRSQNFDKNKPLAFCARGAFASGEEAANHARPPLAEFESMSRSQEVYFYGLHSLNFAK